MKFNLQLFALKKKNMVFINDGASATPKTAEKKDNKPAEKKNVGTAKVTTQVTTPVTTPVTAPVTTPVVNTNVASTPVTSTVNGVDENTSAKMQSVFTQSQGVTDAQKEAGQYRDKLKEISSVTDVIDQATWDAINSKFEAPSAYVEAMNLTNSLREQLTSGRTSYSDQIDALMAQIQNRDPFEYDVDQDMLFQQYLASYMASGKTAMQDTMGQAAALTGGYGSSYATAAGNQAYNAYIQDAYNNLPEYYQMAMEAYQMEGEEMYNQLGMLTDADRAEYERMYNAWNVNNTNAQQIYENAYGEWRDSVSNAFNSANLQLNEHGQLYDQAYNTYTAMADHAQTMYQNEYAKWADEVGNAYKYADLLNSDYWNTQEMNQRKAEHDADMAYKYSALAQSNAQWVAEQAAKTNTSTENSGKTPTPSILSDALAAHGEGAAAYNAELDALETAGYNIDEIQNYVARNTQDEKKSGGKVSNFIKNLFE